MAGKFWTLVATGVVLAGSSAAAEDAPEFQSELAPPICDYGSAHPDAPEELDQFDFLIGDYSVVGHRWQDGEWSPPRPGTPARWNGYYTLGGMAIADEWFSRDPGLEPTSERGLNVRMWDPDSQEWDMMWVFTATHQVLDLRAKMIDGRLTMWQVYPEGAEARSYFERLGPDSWHRVTVQPDGEGGWENQFKLVATRIPCPDN